MSLKNQAANGILWTALEKFLGYFQGLFVSVVLARILTPEDFGLMGMLVVFTSMASTFVESGMGSGLIQKKDKSEIDFSTVFVFNLSIALLLYSFLFLAAPYIADFFTEPRLVNLLRVLSLNIILGALVAIQRVKLTIDLNFRSLAKINILANSGSGIIAIFLAWYGLGYWALAAQILLANLGTFIFLLYLRNWKYNLGFSKKSFMELFGFGSNLLAASLYSQALKHVYDVFIGKFYTTADLGFYSRAIKFTELIAGTVNSVVQQVTYPLLAQLKSDPERMIAAFRRLIKMTSFIIFPSMVLLSLLAEPIILTLLTEKWAAAIPFLQWMAFGRIFYPISALNLNLLNANGRSDLFLKVDLSKLPVAIIIMLITIPIGVKAMIIGHVVSAVISFFINTFMSNKLFGYGAISQLKDMMPAMSNSLIMGGLVYSLLLLVDQMVYKLILGLFVGGGIYLLLAYLQKTNEFYELKAILQRKPRVK